MSARALCGLAAALLALLACGCERRPPGRVLLVGIDGASPRIVRPLLAQDRLPHLEAIAVAGTWGLLRAHFPISSPRIWTSMATGKHPNKHGIRGFARKGEDGRQHLFTSADREAHALWNIVSDAGYTVGIVNWWNTYPLEQVRGVLISDHLLPADVRGRRRLTKSVSESEGAIVYPPEWSERVSELLRDAAPLTDVPNPFVDAAGLAGWVKAPKLAKRYEADEAVARIALEVEAELHPDVMLVFLPGIDRVSHSLWAAVEPTSAYPKGPWMTLEQRAATRAAFEAYYEFTDALIGRLLERYGPDDLVLIVSDHGFEAGRAMGYLTGVHETAKAVHGVYFARGPGVAAPAQRAPVSVNDVTPTVLAWMGLPLGLDMDGRPAPFLAVGEVERIATHDTRPIPRLASVPSGAEEEMLEQLRALGYMADAPDARAE